MKGMAILSAMTLPFDAIVGLDINEGSLDICRANVRNFAKTDKARTEFVYIEEMNMIDIDLSPYIVSPAPPSVCNRNNGDDGGEDEGMVPRQEPTTRVCCLLYEPLWTMPKHEAHAIYLRTVQSLKRQCRNQGENAPSLEQPFILTNNIHRSPAQHILLLVARMDGRRIQSDREPGWR